MRKFLFTSIFMMFITPFSFSCNVTSAWEPWTPYQFEQEGKVTGLDNDLVLAIAEKAGCEVEFVKRPWKRALEEIKSGITILAPGASINAEREEYAMFSLPYRQETMSLFVLKENLTKFAFTSLQELTNTKFSLGVTRGYYYGDVIEALIENPKSSSLAVQIANNDKQNIDKLLAGRIDGVLLDPYVGTDILKATGNLDRVSLHAAPIKSDNIYLMFSKISSDQATVDIFNQALQKLIDTGEYQEIINKYLE